ncbi:MAG: hypothetical protein J2O48_03795 [Solirubrobacterales bacterium]|nr:hypothetical protein [Solirubrobacterales bacterium]
MSGAKASSVRRALENPDTARAAWLAGAMIANNVIGLLTAVVFARELSDYGALASLGGYLIILTVAGQAMQVATAREGVLGHLGTGEELLATMARWGRALLIFTFAATIVSVLLRDQIADLVGVRGGGGGPWAAALGIPTGCIYLAESVLRGALQSVGDYRGVGLSLVAEATSRVVSGAPLGLIMGVGGAYLGSTVSYLFVTAYCTWRLIRQIRGAAETPSKRTDAPSFSRHVWRAAIPIVGLAVIQLLQNVDVIIAKHRMAPALDNSYAAVAIAAKVLIWVAMGASFYIVPETSKRATAGEDTRGVLLRSLAIIGVCALPCLLIFAFGAHPLLAAVFGTKKAIASGSLLPLGAAFTVLAVTYMGVQYMLALKESWFLIAIGLVAVVEPVLLLVGPRQPSGFALTILGIQAVGAILTYALALRPRAKTPQHSEQPELLST